jgi:hypothetical protein
MEGMWKGGVSRRAGDSIHILAVTGLFFLQEREYTQTVYIAIKFSQSAFKHGITQNSICRAIINAIYDDILDEDEDKHLFLGFDGNGNVLEILYNIVDEETIRVFHAVKCRDTFLTLVDFH